MSVILTPERIADICARHLSAAEREVCVDAVLRRGAEVVAATNVACASGAGFSSEAEVAAWWLDACRAALRGGRS